MRHPLTLLATTLSSPLPLERASKAVDELLADGIEVEGDHRKVYGWRQGEHFSFSLGAPIVSSRPVLRGRLVEAAGGTEASVTVGARADATVTWTAVVGIGAFGAVYQILLQLFGPEVAPGGRLAGALDVLPGVGLFAVLFGAGLWWWRTRFRSHAEVLAEILRVTLEASEAVVAPSPATPIE